ncbi:MAG TPA: zf-HC2 domain-containing protein, partial [Pyrinomonadaceae bacterium]|nr:zf-HC2 domain-containing protein [Pyrinomonadaceae bacterium]
MTMLNESTIKSQCSPDEIAAYIDGELDPAREVEMDAHFSLCRDCVRELNQQKQFLCSLSSALGNDGEVELPPGFTKLIVANAESNVNGLRRPTEVYNAVFICAGLALFVLFALGSETNGIFDRALTFLDQIGAVGGFIGRIVYSMFHGAAVIVRSLASLVRLDGVMAGALI